MEITSWIRYGIYLFILSRRTLIRFCTGQFLQWGSDPDKIGANQYDGQKLGKPLLKVSGVNVISLHIP